MIFAKVVRWFYLYFIGKFRKECAISIRLPGSDEIVGLATGPINPEDEDAANTKIWWIKN